MSSLSIITCHSGHSAPRDHNDDHEMKSDDERGILTGDDHRNAVYVFYVHYIRHRMLPAISNSFRLLVSGNSNTHFTTKEFLSIYFSDGIVCIASIREADKGESARLVGLEISGNVHITNITIPVKIE